MLKELRDLLGDQKFFEPDKNFIDWLVKYANGRMIVDVGSGNGHVTRAVNDQGGKAIGVDPFMTDKCLYSQGTSFMPLDIRETPFNKIDGNKVLYLLARPCHGGLTEITMQYAQKNSEVLYLGLNKNVNIDFMITKKYTKINAPETKGYEVALSVKK